MWDIELNMWALNWITKEHYISFYLKKKRGWNWLSYQIIFCLFKTLLYGSFIAVWSNFTFECKWEKQQIYRILKHFAFVFLWHQVWHKNKSFPLKITWTAVTHFKLQFQNKANNFLKLHFISCTSIYCFMIYTHSFTNRN